MTRSARITLITVVCVVVAALLLAGGFFFGMSPEFGGKLQNILPSGCATSTEIPSDLELQQEVLRKLEETYYKQVDPAELSTDAIDGMVAGLGDPYTVYMDPAEYADFMQQTSGSYSGVGMTVELKNRLVTIISTFKDSPADLAGIKAGDVIVSVDGISTSGQDLDQVVGRIKGPEGTTVVLELYRPTPSTTTTTVVSGSTTTSEETTEITQGTADVSQLPPGGTTTEYTLTRKTISIPVTDTESLQAGTKKVAYIAFFTFSDGSADALRAEVDKAVTVEHVAAIILDLRSNGGGLLDEAVGVASIFIPSGRIVSTEGLHSPEQVYNATGDAFSQTPLYVLTDPYTASASEIVSGALQDYGRATLIGETTFGKGLVQSIEPLSNGGAVKVTTAVYLTPKGRDINQKGIAPDVEAPDDPNTPSLDETVQTALDLIAGATTSQ
jgi:carboxyl-terminal processing protease